MSQIQKSIDKLKSRPKDFTWEELVRILRHFGYTELKAGKTGGSRRKFTHASGEVISIHKPHPGNIVKRYVLEMVIQKLGI